MGMTNSPFLRGRAATAACALLAVALSTSPLPAQTCFHFGSTPVPATVQPGPLLAGCPAAAGWPAWHLWTPPHRAPAPHAGFAPGDARELPRVLVAYRCTGFLLVPVVPVQVRTMGYVIDQPESPCAAGVTS